MKNKLPNLSYWIFVLTLTMLRGNINAQVIRCHTDEMEKIRRAENPNLETHEQFEKWMSSQISSKEKSRIINGVYTIPVVFHVINNGEAIGTGSNVSQAAIQSQIDVLNEDYRKLLGSNGYNTNSVGADTQIEFCLAQRRPDGSAFTAGQPGVNRINRSTAGFSAPPYADTYVDATIKPYTYNNGVATATRGWDPNKYLNIWLCNLSGGILGYAQFPESPLGGIGCGTTSSATDGVVFMYNSIGKSSVTKNPAPYNEGRTATHEIGHWLGLRHIWGDANGTCGLDDFCNDTPIAANANYGCPTGTNSCTSFPGNDMIENYMDYTDDKCMSTFTNDQKTRMRIVLENSPLRLNLINSDACTPPNPNDASIVNIIKPTGDNCIGSITPSVVLKNRGASNLTSASISYSIDNGAVTTFSFTGSVVPGGTVNVNLPSFSTFAGTHTIKSFSTLPNGVADPSAFNDTVSLQFIVSNGITAPYVQNFEANVFPPDLKWSVNNPNNDCFEWLGASATSISGVAINKAAQMPAFGNTSAGTENLITPIFILPCNASAANIQFDVAYRRRNSTTSNYERLYVDISQDCGATWTATPIYDKLGTALQVLTTVLSSEYIPVGASDWRTETIDLLPFVTTTSKNVKFRFRAVAANGNDIYIDNFKFNATSPAEISVLQSTNEILDEGAYTFGTIASGTSTNVTFTVKNTGSSNLILTNPISLTGSAFSVNTSFGTTTIAAGATTTFIISFNPSSGGTFSETLSFVNNDCDEGTYNFLLNGTATGPVNVPVVANFTASVSTICSGQTVTYTSTSTGNPTSYSWSFPGGSPATSTIANPVVTYSTAGTYSATLIATNTSGSNTVTKTNLLTVNALPVVAAITGGNSVCVGSTLSLSSTTSGGVWTSGTIANGTISTTGVLTGVLAGNTVVSYAVTTNGCTTTQNSSITINALPIVSPITGTTTVCAGTLTTLSSSTVGGVWTSASPSVATVSNVGLVTSLTSGTSLISYSLTTAGCTTTQTANVTVNAVPVVAAITGGTSVCVGSTLPLASVTTGGTWTSVTTVNATVSSVGLVTGVLAGSSIITYSKTVSGCTSTQTANVTVNASPVVSPITGTTTVCAGTPTTLSSSTVGGTWSSASPSVATISNGGVVTSLTAGTSIISYSLTTAGCTTTQTAILTVNAMPVVAAITGGTSVCVGSTLPLASVTTGGTWTSGTIANATVSSVGLVTGVLAGSSIITYSKTVSGCTSTQTANVTVNASPVVSPITGTTTVCAGTPTTLSSSTVGGVWTSATPSVATISNGGVVTSLTAGTSLISYSLTTAGCTTTQTANYTVNAMPVVAAITGGTSVCVGSTLPLASVTTGGTWTSGTTANATVSSVGLVTGVLAGSSVITYSKTVSGCTSTQTANVTVNVSPVVSPITGTTTVCAGTPTTLSSSTVGGTWSSASPSVATISNGGVVTSLIAGTSLVSYSLTTAGCTTTKTANVTVNALPVVSAINGVNTICLNTNQTYVNSTVLSGNNTVGQWSSIDPTIITIDQSGKASGLLIGSTTINYLVTTNGCSSTQTKVVNVVAQPVVNPIVGVNSICLNTGSTLTNTSPSGVWSSSLPSVATISSTGSIVGVGVGNVTFSYAVSQNGCTTTQTKTLTVNALPVVSLNGLPTICKNWGTYNLVEGLPLGGQYSGTGISGSVLSFTNSGIYNVGYTYTDNNGCTNSVQSDISISECASLEEVSEVKFDIYPNPTKDELNIISSNESIQDLKIIDNAGRIVFESKSSSLHVQLEVGNFADGLYTIQISSASKMINSKFVVRK